MHLPHGSCLGLLVAGFVAALPSFAAEPCTGTRPIACGVTVTGMLAPAGVDCFTFSAHDGDVVSITPAQATGGDFNACWRLIGPLGASLVDTSCDQRETLLAQGDGIYGVQMFDNGHDASGTYDLTLNAVSGTFNGAPGCGAPIACGQTVRATLEPVGNTDAFTFAARFNEEVSISVSAIAGPNGFQPCWQLFSPSGTEARVSCGEAVSGLLPETGTYTILVSETNLDRTGMYDLNLQPISSTLNGNPSCNQSTLACSAQTFEGTFTSPAETDAYTFAGRRGEIVGIVTTVLAGADHFNPCWRVVGPSGEPLNEFTCGPGQVTLDDADGAYAVIVVDNGQDTTGTYRLGFGTPECPTSIVPTTTLPTQGTVPAGEVCGNCFDDDDDERIDVEDPMCCDQLGRLLVKRAKVSTGKAAARGGRIKIAARLGGADFAGVNPQRDDLEVQLRNGNGELLCALVDHRLWKKKGRAFAFRDQGGRTGGWNRGVLRVRPRGATTFRATARKLDLTRYDRPDVTITVAVGRRCSNGTVLLRHTRNGLVFP